MWNNSFVARLWQKLGQWHSPRVLVLGLILILAGSGVLVWQLFDNIHTFNHATHLLTRLEMIEQDVRSGNNLLIELSSAGNARQREVLSAESHRQLRLQVKQMERNFAQFQKAIEPVLETQDIQGELVWWALQLRQKWAATHTYMSEPANKSWQQAKRQKFLPPLSAQTQPTFSESASEFRQAYRNYIQAQMTDARRHALWASLMIACGLLITAALFWHRWWQPISTLKQLGNTPQVELLPDFPDAPSGAEWEGLWGMLQRMHRRLRLAEQFMRDLSMGRTPEPIPPEGEGDRLARSSYWLTRRWQQHQKELEQQRDAA